MYNRQKAVKYAFEWWNKRNPKFFNFDEIGGDCTNFVSQCLFFGGIQMNFERYGWFYQNINSRSPAWTGVDEFYYFSINNNLNSGVRAKIVSIEDIEVGDVIQLRLNEENEFHHSLFITEIVGPKNFDNILLTSHSYDAKNKPISHYFVKDIRFLKILN